MSTDSKDTLKNLYKAYKALQIKTAKFEEPIAVTGIGCRFPGGADTPEKFWQILEKGQDVTSEVPKDRWSVDTFYDPDPDAVGKSYTKRGGFLSEPVSGFDNGFFQISPDEAKSMDPQQRMLLEVTREALENSATDPNSLAGTLTGVFIGIVNNDYMSAHLRCGDLSKIDSYSITGIAASTATGRISYTYGLEGPSVAIDTACSSSLAAIHLACQSLKTGESDMALAGGVHLNLTPEGFIGFCKIKILSPDGRCRSFDAQADGMSKGEGCGIVVLKRLSDAISHGDRVIAVIKGSAMNQDGRSNGLTAPNGLAQEKVMRKALEKAAIEPSDVGYIEAHGSATSLGDTVEIQSITNVYRNGRGNALSVGTVKANIGHLEGAAGVAGFIKTALMLEKGIIPPLANFEKPNPLIQWDSVKIDTSAVKWDNGARIAAVSSYGFSGTNVHLIVGEPSVIDNRTSGETPGYQLLNISAKTKEALRALAKRHHDYLVEDSDVSLADICYTAAIGRAQLPCRLSVTGKTKGEMCEKLESSLNSADYTDGCVSGEISHFPKKIVFMFAGQGSQYRDMGKDLYQSLEVFRNAMDACDAIAKPITGKSIIEIIYGNEDADLINETLYTQPAIFSVEYALAMLWLSWGVKPSAVMGHSIGQYVAACVAGVFSLTDAVTLVCERGRLIQSLTKDGSMAVVLTDEKTVNSLIEKYSERVSLAAVNGPENVVISGDKESVSEVIAQFIEMDIPAREIKISHAIHSVLMEPILGDFLEAAKKVSYSAPKIPLVSNADGRFAADETATPEFWVKHLRGCVRFYDSVVNLDRWGFNVFIEVGAATTLMSLGIQCLPDNESLWVYSLGINNSMFNMRPMRYESTNDWQQMLRGLSELFVAGVEIDWKGVIGSHLTGRKKVALPTYPYERKHLWIAPVYEYQQLKAELPSVDVSAQNEQSEPAPQRENFQNEILNLIRKISGIDISIHDYDKNLFTLGLVSLMITRIRDSIRRTYGVDIKMSSFYKETSTVNKLLDYIKKRLPQDAPSVTPLSDNSGTRSITEIPVKQTFTVYRKIMEREALSLDKIKQAHVNKLIKRYTEKTAASRAHTQKYRSVFANIRNISGFRMEWKDMIYQIVAKRAEGSKIWDMDGRRYLDISMGFGVYLFGHNPPFIRPELEKEFLNGFPIGPMSQLAAENAQLICEMANVERVAFFNTGTEAVMAAVRIARTVTGRDKLVVFSGAYHGHSDGVLATGYFEGDILRTVPLSPGTPQGMVNDVYVLNYDEPASLEFIKKHGKEIAAVMVEPVQSRRPDLQPAQFLKALRELTEDIGSALIFDEMITGFRTHPGGAQAWFGIKADIVTYGKVIGGGLPIGVVAGKAQYLDAVDGGFWSFDDGSYPQRENTLIAGTFNHHPLAMAGARAVMQHLKNIGPTLQSELNQRTDSLSKRINEYLTGEGISTIQMVNFASLFRFVLKGDDELLNYHLLDRGIYVWEGRACFLSTAHTDDDIKFFEDAVRDSIAEMKEGGFFQTDSVKHKAHVVKPTTVPVSSAQRRLYALSQFEGGQLSYHVPVVFFIDGALDIKRFGSIFNELINRHESLRSSFVLENGEIRRLAAESVDFDVQYAAIKEDATEGFVRDFIRDFELSKAPLIRVCLANIEDGKNRSLCIIDAHHIVFDGISADILVGELIELYRKEKLQPLKKQYRDYTAWEADYTKSHEFQLHEKFWLDMLSDNTPVLNLPYDFQRPKIRSFNGKRLFVTIDETKTTALKEYSAKCGVSLYALLFAAHSVLLHKLTGQSDLIIGTNFDGRNHEDLTDVIGMFVSTLALRTRPEVEKHFNAFVSEIQETVLEALDCQSFPFEILVNKLHLKRDVSKNPLFDTMFVYEKIDTKTFVSGDLTFRKFDYSIDKSMFDLTHEFLELEGTLNMSMEFNTALFKVETIERFLNFYENILNSILTKPDIAIRDIGILSEEESRRLTVDFNSTAKDFPLHLTIADLFERQAAKTPENIAIKFNDITYTYRTLNEKSNRVANFLKTHITLNDEELIAIMADRSEWTVVAMLGILKAGAAFLPIDPAYPEDRISYMIEDSGCRILLTHLENIENDKLEVINIKNIICDDSKNPVRTITPKSLAYVIYTSGTTGRPKGVMIEHETLVNMALAHIDFFEITDSDRMLQFSSMSSDTSLFEIFLSLFAGAAVVLIDKETIFNTANFIKYIEEMGVTFLALPPVYLNSLNKAQLGTVRAIASCGAPAVVSDALFYGKNKVFFNSYGPTETTVAVTYYRLDMERSYDAHIPIGPPISNTCIYIVDESLNLVPIGIEGELCIGGKCLARGYKNKPETTAEKFIMIAAAGDQRLYRSGDMGRWLSDGNIECTGRKDDQLKVRGYRVELSEVEYAVSSHHMVKAVVVIARKFLSETPELIAYIIKQGTLTAAELRAYMGKRLPDYMIPAYIVFVDKFPLSPNNKVDKKALPDPIKTDENGNLTEPSTETERVLVRALMTILDRKTVGVNDDFFALGGDSIKAIQLISALNAERLSISVRDVFENPVLTDMARKITGATALSEQGIVTGTVPLTAIQRWFFDSNLTSNHYTQGILLNCSSRINKETLNEAFTKLMEHHDTLRMEYTFSADGRVIQECSPDINAITVETVVVDNDSDIAELCAAVPPTVDLKKGQLLKAVIYKGQVSDYLLIVIHHLIVDGVSWRILIEDISQAYKSITERTAVTFPPKTASYKAWAETITEYAALPQLLKEAEYWNSVCKTVAEPIKTDYDNDGNFETLNFTLNSDITTLILTNSTETRDILLSALLLAVYETYGVKTIAVELEGHGREEIIEGINVSRTVGWFTSVYPVVLNISESGNLDDTIKHVKETLRKVPQNGIGYGILKYISGEHGLSLNQSPQIAFNYLGSFDSLQQGGVFKFSDIVVENTISHNFRDVNVLSVEGFVVNNMFHGSISYNTGVYTAETVSALTEAYKSQIITLTRAKTAAWLDTDDICIQLALNAEDIKDIYNLSPMQEGMLFHRMYDKRSSAYFEQVTFTVKGALDVSAFIKSWENVFERHDILRAMFIYSDRAEPIQVIPHQRQIEHRFVDMSKEPESGRFLNDYRKADIERGFDLARDPLMRIYIVKRADNVFDVVWSHHHIIIDGWCLGIIITDLFDTYSAFTDGKPLYVKSAPSYGDYIKWLKTLDVNIMLDYWRGYLEGYERAAFFSAQLSQNSGVSVFCCHLGEDLTARLDTFAKTTGVTISAAFQALWSALLSKHTGEDDVVFGLTVSGRPIEVPESEKMIGLFINTIPVRAVLNDNVTFRELAKNVQYDFINGKPHHYVSLADIQSVTKFKQGLFDHVLVFENYPLSGQLTEICQTTGCCLTVDNINVYEETNYNLTLVIYPGVEITVDFCYNTGNIKSELIERTASALIQLTELLINSPDTAVNNIRGLLAGEDELLKQNEFLDSVGKIDEDF
ncbi:amino acid adenylation domain-containing protein [Candidatus Magnetomonas plexicatena]|uniref:amino acid adenylation domain-containing protein n=1 Tax=Candidatus Magnetomonas plexicatena TaxID=2552947 RepID=UPI001C741F57|nr:amino acid adenylation domain-containing protein [Nitrospirales bacterium LBB_01]